VLGDRTEDLENVHVVEEGGRRGEVEALVSCVAVMSAE
jgi:hypothetical protein